MFSGENRALTVRCQVSVSKRTDRSRRRSRRRSRSSSLSACLSRKGKKADEQSFWWEGSGIMFVGRKYRALEEAVEGDQGRLRLLLLLLQGYTLLPGSQHFVEGVDADGWSVGATDTRRWASLKSDFDPVFSASAYLMLWIHSSFSSGVGAEMRYTMWFPSTTRPSASVLHAFISWPRLLGMYNSKQFWEAKERLHQHWR